VQHETFTEEIGIVIDSLSDSNSDRINDYPNTPG